MNWNGVSQFTNFAVQFNSIVTLWCNIVKCQYKSQSYQVKWFKSLNSFQVFKCELNELNIFKNWICCIFQIRRWRCLSIILIVKWLGELIIDSFKWIELSELKRVATFICLFANSRLIFTARWRAIRPDGQSIFGYLWPYHS